MRSIPILNKINTFFAPKIIDNHTESTLKKTYCIITITLNELQKEKR